MAFAAIDNNKIKVGDPITKDILDLIKGNFDDHELRISSLSVTGGTVFVFNGDIDFTGYSSSYPDIFYYKARASFSVTEFKAQLFTKQSVATGSLTLRLEKATNTNDSNFSSILTTDITFNFASVSDYAENSAAINASLNNITIGDVLRVKVISLPSGFYGKVLLNIGAQ